MKSKIKKGKGCLIGMFIVFMGMPIIMLILIVAINTPDRNQLAIKINVPLEVLQTSKSYYGDDYPIYMTKLAIENQFDWESLDEKSYEDVAKLPIHALERIYKNNPSEDISTIYEVYRQAYSSLEYFPIPRYEKVEQIEYSDYIEVVQSIEDYEYQLYNDFGAARNYKEESKHEGNDLVADEWTPLVSITDGVIDKYGWNEHGGYRIGVKTKEGAYFYYAHMEQYAKGLYKGKKIKAGDHIGYVGDTGYGPEGTEGKFINHLHFQIGIDLGGEDGQEYFWINTYDILRLVEDSKVIYYEDGKTSINNNYEGSEE